MVDYARPAEARSLAPVCPARDLEMLLTLYADRLSHGIEVTRAWDEEILVPGDRDRLNQVWVNLINNALEAMGPRGRLRLEVVRDGSEALIRVADSGPGVAPGNREKLFQPFFTTKGPGEGTGLGLHLCRRLVEAHGGTLAWSEDQGMTVFTVRLPRLLDDGKPVQ
jgi:signal transduction histidine kinase